MDRVALSRAWLERRDVVAVFEDREDPKPSDLMWLEWREGEISFMRDTRYVRSILAEADLAFEDDAVVRSAGSNSARWKRALSMEAARPAARACINFLCKSAIDVTVFRSPD